MVVKKQFRQSHFEVPYFVFNHRTVLLAKKCTCPNLSSCFYAVFFRSLFNLETNSHFFFSSSFCVCVRTSPAELLSQLSGVRRAAGGQINSSGPSASQLQQLQMQLQLERQQAQAARQQVETSRHATRRGNNPGNTGAAVPQPSTATANTTTVGESNPASSSHSSQFLLARWVEQEVDFRVCL